MCVTGLVSVLFMYTHHFHSLTSLNAFYFCIGVELKSVTPFLNLCPVMCAMILSSSSVVGVSNRIYLASAISMKRCSRAWLEPPYCFDSDFWGDGGFLCFFRLHLRRSDRCILNSALLLCWEEARVVQMQVIEMKWIYSKSASRLLSL